jgi:regulator of PEP synthase PpsR (kinase-PPPase family)
VIDGAVLVVSDATGDTAERVVKAALAQFASHERVRVQVLPHVRDEDAVRSVVDAAKRQGSLLVYTLVSPPLRALLRRLAEEQDVRAVDLLGALLAQMAMHFGVDPLYTPGLGHELDADYFRRIDAVEFAVKNDDGREPRSLRKADVVLVGISRTSKTPLSSYIAHRGYRVSNVPVVLGIPLPKELDSVDPRRVFGLLIDPHVLVEIRRTRMRHLGLEIEGGYGDIRHIREELDSCRRMFEQHPEWTVLDITGKAIEETASAILERYRARFEGAQPASPEAPPAAPPAAVPPMPVPAPVAAAPSKRASKPAAKPPPRRKRS